MTVQELIDKLQEIKNKELPVCFYDAEECESVSEQSVEIDETEVDAVVLE